MPPALVIAIETLELSPLFSTKVPPARTGLAVTPMLLKPTLVPATISEVTGVDDSVVGADGDEAKVAVAYAKKADELARPFMMPLVSPKTQTSTYVEFRKFKIQL